MMAAVPQADLVVMNPTHYAVALKYDDGAMGAPRVVAKGADLLALKIRDLAKDAKVPVLQAPALARALYAHAELDQEIPAALFAAVAQVLAYVYQLRAAMAGRVPMPGDAAGARRAGRARPARRPAAPGRACRRPVPRGCHRTRQLQRLQGLGPNAKAIRALMAPLVVVMILAMMVLPLPPFALDLLFTFNIAMALMVMMVAAYMVRPLDFAAFPAVILLTTLLRLSLNVASTRVVLLEGHTGPGAAGQVIESFGHFLIGGNFAVGLIVFAILVVINFVVVTKGAERIAEVGARFTLDAMPGKQMAIDADMNAGLIDEKEAKRRRAEVGDEAEFFGSMDGASKYVRGDAMAGLLILFINIIGGFIIGVAAARPERRRRPPTATSCWPSATRWWRRFRRC